MSREHLPTLEMMIPTPLNEAQRLKTVDEMRLLDTPAEPEFDELAQLAAAICGTPISCISVVSDTRVWTKARIGTEEVESPRDRSFCAYTILHDKAFLIPDASVDRRFAHHPCVLEKGIRFYAGIPLTTAEGHSVGTLCVLDVTPRVLTPDQLEALELLARQVLSRIEMRRRTLALEAAIDDRDRARAELELANEKLRTLSLTDGLTGLHNRRAFDQTLQREVRRAERYGSTLSLLLLDVDNFKLLNDTVGHVEGDRMLRVIGEVLRAATRSSDLTARYGGEEFAVLMPNADEHSAQITAERIRGQIESFTRDLLPMTVSIGVATFTADVADAFDLVRRADDALYLAKRSGKNRVSTRVA